MAPRLERSSFSTVGIYDGDWFLTPSFERMLDLMSGSPGTFEGIRFFGLLSSGTTELLEPESGGTVWTDPETPPDFTLPFALLEALTSRGLTPFIALGFFPPAVSSNPIIPPVSFERWEYLIESFFRELAGDPRFGPESIASWRFEVWNEPNEGRFWTGTFEHYLDLYRATSDAVRESGLSVSLGGPAMAYKPESEDEDGPDTMRPFLTFLHEFPEVQCDFISYHRKGTVDRSAPDPGRLLAASAEVERLVREIVPERIASLEIINNEADEKIGFESPYPPRMDEFAASWLSTLVSVAAHRAVAQGDLAPIPHRFYPDNANLQLMQDPFDGRRSIYVPVTNNDRTRLIKTPGAVWYDLLPFLDGTLLPFTVETPRLFPESDLHLVAVQSEDACAILATWFRAGNGGSRSVETIDFDVTDLPWETVNVIEFRIDSTHSNSYAAAGGSGDNPAPSPEPNELAALRRAQDLTFERISDNPMSIPNGLLPLGLVLEPFATSCLWITPYDPAPIEAPGRLAVRFTESEIDISWSPVGDRRVLGYEVERIDSGGNTVPLTERPIRPTLVTDERPRGEATYRVRAVSSSNVASDWASIVVTP